MVAPSLPPDVPSLLMPAPSSSTVVPSSSPVALNVLMAAPSLPLDVPSLPTVALSSPPDVPSLPTAGLSSPLDVPSLPSAGPSLPTVALSSPPDIPSLPTAECGRDAEGTSLPLVGSSSDFVSSSSVPSSFIGSSLSFAVPSLSLSMELCHGEVGLSSSSFGSSSSFVPNLSYVVPNIPSVMETLELSSLIGMPLDGKVAREQLSLLVHKMELVDGRKSWSEIAESVIAVELGTLTGSEAEDTVSASMIEEGTGFLFDENGTNLAVEPGVEGSRLSLTTPLIVPNAVANSSQTKESSSKTTSSSDDSSYSSSHCEKSVDSADVPGQYDNISEDDKRDDDVENVDVEDDGALGSADDEWNGTCDVNVGEESDQDEYASDGDHAAVGDDEMGDRNGVDGHSDFSSECDDFSDEQDSFSGEQSGVSGSLVVIVVDDGRDDTDGGSDRRADVTDILRKIKQESMAASLAGSLDVFGNPCGYGKKKKRVRKARERPRIFVGPLVNHLDPSESFPYIVDEDTIKWISANCCRNGVIEALIPGEDERPWTVPDGWLCVYDFWFTEYHLWFPLRVAALFTATDIGVHMSLFLFERIAHITRCDKTDGAFYVSMKAGCGVVGERKRKTLCWIKKFFYVRIAPSSVPDVSDMSVPFRSRHLVGVPLAPGDSECVEYFKETKARDWTVVRRAEVWRCIPFIDSACWRKMDLSEIPSLVDRFAGGIDDAVVESCQCAAGVEPSASARSIVVGLTSTTVLIPFAGVSGKEVVVAGGGSVVAKRAAAGRSPKDASFEPFDHSFNGLASRCGDLLLLFQSPGGVDGLCFDQVRRGEWCQGFACHLAIVKAELEKTKAELASIKDKDDGSEEIAALRGKYEAEKKVSSDALEEVEKLTAKIALEAGRVKKRQAADLEHFKKEKEVAGRRYRRAVTRHDDVLATFNSRMEKVRRYVENQKVVRTAMHGVNQIMGVLDAVKTWKKEAIIIPDGKVKHLENELVRRKEKANLVVRVEFEPKELADIPFFDFTRPLSHVHLSLTAGVEDAAKARGKEENRRREEASRRRVADRAGAASSAVRREGQVPSHP
ncbi:hypothetical protein IGI04_040025 [Brassica rapa subsp. trilocularis]|uniref:Uncharacterized protein n=1 Tax=Brassica rapa subsp. trilocularis TaxID=1813537 RepID=A0ABQ7KLN3_BRACM|nr:hypothetical protein IGI04_040025 [Brassica rapa subsp. trilocularis]